MGREYSIVPRKDFSRGIDAKSTPNRVMEGYLEDLLNMDPNANGSVETRKGYQGYYGYLPLRVEQIQHSGTSIIFTIGIKAQVDMTGAASTPIVVYGKTSSTHSGDFTTTDAQQYYTSFTSSNNTITVTDSGAVSEDYTDSNPELTIWGINHEDIYSDLIQGGGTVKELSVYRSTIEERLVATIGGHAYGAFTATEAATYGMGALYFRLRGGLKGLGQHYYLSPLFVTAANVSAGWTRSRNYVLDDSVSDDNTVTCSAVTNTGAGTAKYTLDFTAKTQAIAIGGVIDTYDKLTVTNMTHAQHNGTFDITGVTNDTNYSVEIHVTNTGSINSDFDETEAAGVAGVFTDQVLLSTTPTFIAGDGFFNSGISSAHSVTVASINGDYMSLSGIDSYFDTYAAVYGQRTSSTIPVVDVSGYLSSSNVVVGDMLKITQYQSGTGTDVAREVRVTAINMDNGTITLDEEFTFTDDAATETRLIQTGRWIPIESPTTNYDLPANIVGRHWDLNDAVSQNRQHTAMINNSMFFVDEDHVVKKFDGTNIYNAGLIRWAPWLFASVDTGTGSIVINQPEVPYSAASGNKFTCEDSTTSALNFGDRVQDDSDGAIYTITDGGITSEYDGAADNDYIYVDRAISGGAGTKLTRVATRSYYFRMNAIDANNNVIASAVTGLGDCTVEMGDNCQVNIKLIGMPVFGNLDYDRIEIETYSTKTSTGGAPYYLNNRVAANFDNKYSYIDIVDVREDYLLTKFDTTNSALLGKEVGTAWEPPPMAKYCGTSGSRLLLGNIKGEPEIDISILGIEAGSVATSDLTGKEWLFRKDNTDTASTTDMVNRVKFEFIGTASATTITPNTDIASTATTFTVTDAAHTLEAGDWVYMYHDAVANSDDLTFAGWWQVASVSAGVSFTVNYSNHGKGVGGGATTDTNRYIRATAGADVPVLIGVDGNLGWQFSNPSWSYENTAALRLSMAVNAVMRTTDVSISGYTAFKPWMYANAGSLFSTGQIVIRQIRATTTCELQLDSSFSTDFRIFVNNVKRTDSEQVSAVTRLFPSRLCRSYPNYPEMFDAPYAISANTSDSAIDVNSADGQEITGHISFFGDASFGNAQVEGMEVVFKQDHVYIVDVERKQYHRIDQPYGGCTAPDSIAHTKEGVIWANENGIYRLGSDMQVVPIASNLERKWLNVNKSSISVCAGHNDNVANKYKLAVPYGSSQTENNYCVVYSSDRQEGDKMRPASLTLYDAHPATCWASMGNDTFFGTYDGQVFKLRNNNEDEDYRDDAGAISMEILFPGEDFNLAGVMKSVSDILVEFYNDGEEMNTVTVAAAINMSSEFYDMDSATIDDETGYKITNAWFSPPQRKCDRIQIKITCSTVDTKVVIAGVGYRAAAFGTKGIREAAEL